MYYAISKPVAAGENPLQPVVRHPKGALMRHETAAWLRRYVSMRGHHMPHKSTAQGQAKVEIDPVREQTLYTNFVKYVRA